MHLPNFGFGRDLGPRKTSAPDLKQYFTSRPSGRGRGLSKTDISRPVMTRCTTDSCETFVPSRPKPLVRAKSSNALSKMAPPDHLFGSVSTRRGLNRGNTSTSVASSSSWRLSESTKYESDSDYDENGFEVTPEWKTTPRISPCALRYHRYTPEEAPWCVTPYNAVFIQK